MAYIKFADGYYEGEVLFGVPDGKGDAYYDNGNHYSGEWKHGYVHGKGAFTNSNGSKYVGEFSYNKMHGNGTFYFATGNTQECRFINGMQDGTSTIYYPSLKLKRVIEYKNNKQISDALFFDYDNKPVDGNSVCLNHANGYYIGEIKDGKRHGFGQFAFNDGRRYVGEFENDSLHGNGKMYFENGKILVGKWEHGLACGKCVWFFPGGLKQIVEYENSKEIHLGEIVHSNEDPSKIDASSINSDQVSSKKNLTSQSLEPKISSDLILKDRKTVEYPDGSKYVGKIKNGNRHGKGIMYFSSGNYYEGEWKNDNFHGKGKLCFPKIYSHVNKNNWEIVKFESGCKIVGTWQDTNNAKKLTLIYPDGSQKKLKLVDGDYIFE